MILLFFRHFYFFFRPLEADDNFSSLFRSISRLFWTLCNSNRRPFAEIQAYTSKWICRVCSRFVITLGLYLSGNASRSPTWNHHYQSQSVRLLPKDYYFLKGVPCHNHFYGLPGQTVDSPELLFDNFFTPLNVSLGEEFQIWFTEDLYKCGYADNGLGKTCVLVFGLFD